MPALIQIKCGLHVLFYTYIWDVANTITGKSWSAGSVPCLHLVHCQYRYRANVFCVFCSILTFDTNEYCRFCSIIKFGILSIPLQSKCVLQVVFYIYIWYVANTITEQMYSVCSILYLDLVRCQYLNRANLF